MNDPYDVFDAFVYDDPPVETTKPKDPYYLPVYLLFVWGRLEISAQLNIWALPLAMDYDYGVLTVRILCIAIDFVIKK